MNPKKKLKKYITKGVRKVRHRKGFGVHSPFAFSLITQVIDEQLPYYAYENIRRIRRQYARHSVIPGRSKDENSNLKTLYLLYRLANRFNPMSVLEINNNGGVATAALSMFNSSATVSSVVSDPARHQTVRKIIENENVGNVRLYETDIASALESLPKGYNADFILIHKNMKEHCVDTFLKFLSSIVNPHTVIFIEGIHSEGAESDLWLAMQENPQIRVTMDLYEAGIAIYNDRLYKQNYIVSF